MRGGARDEERGGRGEEETKRGGEEMRWDERRGRVGEGIESEMMN